MQLPRSMGWCYTVLNAKPDSQGPEWMLGCVSRILLSPQPSWRRLGQDLLWLPRAVNADCDVSQCWPKAELPPPSPNPAALSYLEGSISGEGGLDTLALVNGGEHDDLHAGGLHRPLCAIRETLRDRPDLQMSQAAAPVKPASLPDGACSRSCTCFWE